MGKRQETKPYRETMKFRIFKNEFGRWELPPLGQPSNM